MALLLARGSRSARLSETPFLSAALSLSPCFLVMSLSTSSTKITGAEKPITARHSASESGATANVSASHGTYRMRQCNAMDTAMAPVSHGLDHGWCTSNDPFSESALSALNISTTHSTERLIVLGFRFTLRLNTSHEYSQR